MSRRLASAFPVFFFIAFLSSSLAAQDTSSVSGNLKVQFLNVGQAYAILVQCPSEKEIDIVVASHFHAD